MLSKRRRDQRQLEILREGYHEAQDTTPARVPDTYEARAAFERESLSLQILDAVQQYLNSYDYSQQAIAEELGITEGRVSQILSGEQNLTLKTLASLAAGLKGHFDIKLVPATGTPWEGGPKRRPPSSEGEPTQVVQNWVPAASTTVAEASTPAWAGSS
jgi:transcriptional regulator with XRE-family HTH domain